MKIECIKEQLEYGLSTALKIAGKSQSLPVLSGFYLEAGQNVLIIKATNLDLGISIKVPAKVSLSGVVVVPAQILSSFVSSLSKDHSISMASKDNLMEVKTSSTKTNIKVLPSDEFPVIPEISDDGAFSIPSRDLVYGIRSVIYAASIGSIKPELSSVSVTHDGDHLVFAATDSFRLAEKRVRIKKMPHFKQILIPQKNAAEIAKIFDQIGDDVSISIGENQIALRSEGVYLASRVIDGIFPDYRQIIPPKHSSSAIVLKQDLINSLKTSLIFSDSFNQLTLKVFVGKKIFEMETKNLNVGDIVHKVDAVLEGEDISINVNHRYFTDCLQSISADSISLEFSGQAKPIVMRGVGEAGFLYLVMPMNQS